MARRRKTNPAAPREGVPEVSTTRPALAPEDVGAPPKPTVTRETSLPPELRFLQESCATCAFASPRPETRNRVGCIRYPRPYLKAPSERCGEWREAPSQ